MSVRAVRSADLQGRTATPIMRCTARPPPRGRCSPVAIATSVRSSHAELAALWSQDMSDDAVVVEASRREVPITSPGKVFFSERGDTKLDLVRYYQAVEVPLLRAMGGRPVLLQRFPNGAGGPSFFQKRVPESRPDWLETTIVTTPNGTTSRALVVVDLAHVLWA